MTRRVAEPEAELEVASRLLNTYKAMLFGSPRRKRASFWTAKAAST